jgi:hypothetical protein
MQAAQGHVEGLLKQGDLLADELIKRNEQKECCPPRRPKENSIILPDTTAWTIIDISRSN